MPHLKVLKPGFQTTVQDLGRTHFAHVGVSASGAADPISFRVGNLLVDNEENAPSLEMTLVGGEFIFESSTIIAMTGSDFGPTLDGERLPLWTTILVRAGQTLQIGATKNGARCYLAIQGGFVVPKTLGSASTHILTSIGGHHGRPLLKSDLLEYKSTPQNKFRQRTFDHKVLEELTMGKSLRVTDGPQIDLFPGGSLKVFTTSPYVVSEDSNRMGIRLVGPSLERKTSEDMITEGVSLGAIQVSHDGKPIILFVEHQTTGGYPKIANIIAADIHRVGQLRPRDEVRFTFVSMDEAASLFKALESRISQISFVTA